ncbi:dipeptide ABC transporter ATP-binding protein [Nocardia miyunensis]|uniref:dipeptide ABC transporter ATP-binding protein n=1 Tax=Nocardia miyunensis TaxID=282684 RepID=UPI000A4FE737|nr:ABC transporter ATP-binding protein [Nocardia miyunensis]
MSTATAETTSAPGTSAAEIAGLRVAFRRDGRDIHALRGVSLAVPRGEILGLVGESGSGKSVLGMALLGLLPRTATVDGTVEVAGADMRGNDPRVLRRVRRLHLGAVFQDPMTSLNPTMRIGAQVIEAAGSAEEGERLLAAAGVPEPRRRMRSYPHELSGGLRQRVMIAMAVAGDPDLIIADEPTTALDVTVQAQVLALLRRICDTMGTSILLITHDLGVAGQIADRIAVLYAGRIAEIGLTAEVLATPAHPYTIGLLRSRLTLDTPRISPLPTLPGAVPASPLPGCAFAPRCDRATPDCDHTPPDPLPITPTRTSACPIPAPFTEPVIPQHDSATRPHLAAAAPGDRSSDHHTEPESSASTPASDIASVAAAVSVGEDAARSMSTAAARSAGAESSVMDVGGGESAPGRPGADGAGIVAATADVVGEQVDSVEPAVVSVHDVTKTFTVGGVGRRAGLQALRRVSVTVRSGESLAIVGESGCGKSTLLRVMAGLEQATSGSVTLAGHPQMVFQDAGASLTPWLPVGEQIAERLRGTGMTRTQRRDAVATALGRVGLPADIAKSRAARLSGGQRQRVSLARATVVPPAVLLCDEPTSALDVSLAASVLNLISELRAALDMSVVFVTHDLSVARVIADRIAVMHLGQVVEIGPADRVVTAPVHPYTAALIASVPDIGATPAIPTGEAVSPLHPPTGCGFHPRCPLATPTCADPALAIRLEGRPGSPHQVACIERKTN